MATRISDAEHAIAGDVSSTTDGGLTGTAHSNLQAYMAMPMIIRAA